jgi:hypothetical protein
MEGDYLEVKIPLSEHQLRCDPAEEVQQTQMVRMQSHHYINDLRSTSSPWGCKAITTSMVRMQSHHYIWGAPESNLKLSKAHARHQYH